MTGGAVVLAVSHLVSDTFPPVHLLDPLHQLGVVGVDVVVGLLLMVSSATYHHLSPQTAGSGRLTVFSPWPRLDCPHKPRCRHRRRNRRKLSWGIYLGLSDALGRTNPRRFAQSETSGKMEDRQSPGLQRLKMK